MSLQALSHISGHCLQWFWGHARTIWYPWWN